MSDNSAVVKIIAQHAREYNDLDTLYKKLGVKYITSVSRERDLSNAFAELNILTKQLKGENKKLRVLLQVAKKEIEECKKL